jgi:methionyl-tRNA formyltransferase
VKFGFVTCVSLGLEVMREIYRVGGELELAFTLPDEASANKAGRVWIDDFCSEHEIDLLKAPSVNDAALIHEVRSRGIDWLFIIGWSQIAQAELLAAPVRGCIGMHPTLLPKGRGRASIPWAIIKQEEQTGVTMFVLDEGVDTGPVLAQQSIALSPQTTATNLYHAVTEAHRLLIVQNWDQLHSDQLPAVPQDDSRATVWPARTPEDGEILHSMTKAEATRIVRATTHPYPGAFWVSDSEVVRVWSVSEYVQPNCPTFECADGRIAATEYQLEPGRPVGAAS